MLLEDQAMHHALWIRTSALSGTDQYLSQAYQNYSVQIKQKELLPFISGICNFQEGILMQCAYIVFYQIHKDGLYLGSLIKTTER